ncbi:purine nucleoside phosphoramidase [Wigglesworthia glossinidia endosymbiont of Glossina morsitans morsitans (Yale colony)]|uniref:Purine nucleoside phosphoramidase n=1 Tax=Wigglesworthia glossinidia endosymbiont of Glossina morsitans morsitans (Yale colony) TaxID=1142511 RepID=H6Q5Q8_WIGGL|nr:purine nucleoside phosphoramidase [Wigglesworthia glossinidia endosymbiont of Glossina morsitans morsitans (Yale colony)]
MKENIFIKILQKKSPANIIYQDNYVTAFRDKNPQAPIHVIIITNILIPTVNDVKDQHALMLGHLFLAASKIAVKEKINKSGYRLIINCNKDGGQEIYHLHMHLLGGKNLGKLLY